jgi:hypothetical protein
MNAVVAELQESLDLEMSTEDVYIKSYFSALGFQIVPTNFW